MNYPSSPLIDKHFDVAALRLFMNTCSKYIDDRIQNVITRHKTKKCRNESVEYFTNPLHSKHL